MSEVTTAGTHSLGSRKTEALLFAILASLLAMGCEIAPIVSTTEPTVRYGDCERAAEGYCEHVVEAVGHDAEKCIAEYRFKCVAGSSK